MIKTSALACVFLLIFLQEVDFKFFLDLMDKAPVGIPLFYICRTVTQAASAIKALSSNKDSGLYLVNKIVAVPDHFTFKDSKAGTRFKVWLCVFFLCNCSHYFIAKSLDNLGVLCL